MSTRAKKNPPAVAKASGGATGLPLEVVLRPVSMLKRYERNARVHSPAQVRKIAASIRRFGFRAPMLVTPEGEIVAGHGRLEAALELGLERVPVIVLSGMSALEARAYRLADNRLAELAEWDEKLLADELLELGEFPELDLEDLGWSEADLAELEGPTEEEKAEIIEAPDIALPVIAVSRPGDVWHLGQHRLGCGDCRDPAAVERVLGSKRADLVVTDPPYCSGGFQEAGRSAGTFGDIAADNLSSRGYIALMRAALTAANAQTAYVFTDWRMWMTLFDVVESSGLAVRSMIVWNKGTPGLGALWRTQHELVMFATRKPNKRIKGVPAFGNVVSLPRTGNKHHVTEKPIKLIERILEGDAPSGRGAAVAVYDPFSGSGTTLLACELRGRRFSGLEVEPKYCDVIVRRFQEMTGKEVVLGGDASKTFARVTEERGER